MRASSGDTAAGAPCDGLIIPYSLSVVFLIFSWQYCGENTPLIHAGGTMFDQVTLELGLEPC